MALDQARSKWQLLSARNFFVRQIHKSGSRSHPLAAAAAAHALLQRVDVVLDALTANHAFTQTRAANANLEKIIVLLTRIPRAAIPPATMAVRRSTIAPVPSSPVSRISRRSISSVYTIRVID